MNSKTTALIAVAVIIVAGWLIYRHNNASIDLNQGLSLPYGSDNAASPAPVAPAPAASAVKEFTVSGGNYYFSPKTMTVNKGDTVKINFVNSGGMHNLVIDEFNAKTPTIQSGQTASITFVADKTGTFQYYCAVESHRAMGMFGTLTVQ